jgi:hypothetical protein
MSYLHQNHLKYKRLFNHQGYYVYWTMLLVSLDCPFLIAPSVFSNVYFHLPYSQSGPFLIHDRVITGFVTRVISGNTTGATCEGGTVYLSQSKMYNPE